MEKENELIKILEGEFIRPVFQPIVSLRTGDVLGYEALSRITLPDSTLSIEELFHQASERKRLWELEKLCRKKALEAAIDKPLRTKLFLNVDANIIHDPDLKSGFTWQQLAQFKIDPEDIVFEITEKNAVNSVDVFIASIEHYRSQNFKIGIDDFGSGYSGLNRVCAFSPDYIKLDMDLIRDIDKDPIKKSAVAATINFCKEAGIRVIAEGVETLEELKVLIYLGADYAQGYYLSKPNSEFLAPNFDTTFQITSCHNKAKPHSKGHIFGKISEIGTVNKTVLFNKPSILVYDAMKEDSAISEFFVVDESNKVCGILPRRHILEKFSGEYGYNLNKKTKISDIMIKDFLAVDEAMGIDEVANLSMERQASCIYDSVAVTSNQEYKSTVTVKDLLLAAVSLQVKRAADSNPLTGLPGNNQIQEMIINTFVKTSPWSIAYFDMDNFKAYNDAYGFSNGDLMIKALADSMRKCCYEGIFIGHIGGDDFVVIVNNHNAQELCSYICKTFREAICFLYHPDDWKRGYIVSKNRSGFTQTFPIVTLSIAIVTNKAFQPSDIEELSSMIAEIKKKCKQTDGDVVIVV